MSKSLTKKKKIYIITTKIRENTIRRYYIYVYAI